MNMQKPLLVLDNITLKVQECRYFEGTNWRINDDEQWALIGRMGAGKSLLASALCRRIAIVQGQILFFFDENRDGRSYLHRGEIALVSADTQRELLQRYAGYHQARWQSTEGEDVPTVAKMLSRQHTERISPYEMTFSSISDSVYESRRAQTVESLRIGHLLDRKILHLSNGEARKVLLARALIQSPRLLILDDPFGGLDEESRRTLAMMLADILARGQQRLLLATSRPEEIPDGITHVLGVEQHRIAIQGPKATVLEAPFTQQVFNADPQAVQDASQFSTRHWETSPPGATLVALDHVNIRYHEVTILHDVTWTMKQGEHWAIRGPNGAGKSTLLSLILGDNPQAYANDITLFGRRRGSGESIWDIKRHIGWVAPELHIFYQDSSTCEMVVRSGFFDSIGVYREVASEQARQAAGWMQTLGIESLGCQPFHAVSIGEQRLILLARALVKQPELLILDEPCQGLDVSHRSQLIGMLNTLCQQTPVSLLYVTHHQDELPGAITHVLELEQGRIRACNVL
jgi:molybdate transport system ATP-binding protein